MNINIVLVVFAFFYVAVLGIFKGFLGRMEVSSVLVAGPSAYNAPSCAWAKDTILYLGLIGAWRVLWGVGVAIFEVYEVSQ